MILTETPLDRQFAACMRHFDPAMEPAVEWSAKLVSHALGEGHVCLDLHRWAGKEVSPGLRLPSVHTWKKVLSNSPVVGQPGEFKPMIVEGDRLYLARYWRYENRLAESLLAWAAEIRSDVDIKLLRQDLDALFAHNAGAAVDWQKLAAAVAVLRRLCVISGGPGTGKTSTVVRILAALQSQAGGQLRIALAAPTGKAAARMQESIRAQKQALGLPGQIAESIPEDASTLHRLLGGKPDSAYFRHNSENPLAVDVVVVDEGSMIDLAMLSKLVDAMPAQARLILLGDKDQLDAVEPGAVFADICAGSGYSEGFSELLRQATGHAPPAVAEPSSPLADCIALLHHSHRFGGDSGIGELARRVLAGSEASPVLELLLDGSHADIDWRRQFDESDLLARMEQGYREYFQAVEAGAGGQEALAAFAKFRVLAALRQGPSSASSANRLFESACRERLRIPAYERWYPGRPVIVTQNDYTLRLFNGDVGVCLKSGGEMRVYFDDSDGGLRSFAPARLPEHELVYAMTVHKSQGSEFDEALLLLPENFSQVSNRPLIYTAVSRAKQRAEIWGRPAILASAIENQRERNSGLRNKLWRVA